ncbi:MAG: PIN domain-containing protein [Candidatus Electrothrix sp. GW3-4]|uniref:type II toxin-antitoxin system VapC family toxin n=1 Tax=Candidatus Electrothrix sp. GW3-4 TaxID=3126740 RepID=UPI0030CC37B2
METTDDRRRVFVDTNILIYASNSGSPFHQFARDAIKGLEEENAELFINRQVLREYLATMTRPDMLTEELPRESVIEAIRHFEEDFTVFNDTPGVTEQLLELAETISVSGKQIHDANIVATMLVNDVHELLTHNVSDFKRFSTDIEVVPLVA